MYKSKLATYGLSILCAVIGLTSIVAAEDRVFDMRKVSVFSEAERNEELSGHLLSGCYTFCDTERSDEVKKYPKLKSSQPLYGIVAFDEGYLEPSAELKFHFAIDESVTEKPRASKRSLLKRLTDGLFGSAEDEVSVNFDRLYFDANRDLDLTNDPVVKPMKKPPVGLVTADEDERWDNTYVFDPVTIEFDHGQEMGSRTLQVVPVLEAMDRDYAYIRFVFPMARKGSIRIGQREFSAVLAQTDVITGRFDRLHTSLFLMSRDKLVEDPFSWGGNSLRAMREFDDRLYSFSTTPAGDRLIVQPYEGEYGLLEVGAGRRKVDKLGVVGTLLSREQRLLAVGKSSSWYSSEKTRQQRLPVGDYCPMQMSVEIGRLELDLSLNHYSESAEGETQDWRRYCVAIRKDNPYLLAFSDEPSVTFISPPADKTYKPGDEVDVEAVLVDPKLGLMISDIKDTARKIREIAFTEENGNAVEYTEYASLDPTVVISDASGKRIASGKMPFG